MDYTPLIGPQRSAWHRHCNGDFDGCSAGHIVTVLVSQVFAVRETESAVQVAKLFSPNKENHYSYVTGCQIQMHRIPCRLGLRPDPTRELTAWAAPGFLSWGTAMGQGGGHRGKRKLLLSGLSTEKN